MDGFLVAGAVLCALALVFSLVQENHEALRLGQTTIGSVELWKLEVLGTGTSATLLSGFLSLFFLRRQFLRGAVPVFDYRNNTTTESDAGFAFEGDQRHVFFVEITNVGQGIGIITGARYWVEPAKGDDRPKRANFLTWFEQRRETYGSRRRYAFTSHQLENELERAGIKRGKHFRTLHFGNWTAIAPGETRRVFEITYVKALSLVALDIEITYESVVGDRYRREIYAIPRRQLSAWVDGSGAA